MKDSYDFSEGRQGAVLPAPSNKVRITIRLDGDVVSYFKEKVHQAKGGNYQTLINDALRQYVDHQEGLLEETLRRVIREELRATG